jgi:Flp pilus assembly protein TadG
MLSRQFRGRRGSVALEAAVTLPVLVTLFLGAFDLFAAVTSWRSTRTAAIAIAEAASSYAVQQPTSTNPNGTNVITSTQVWDASTAVFPYLRTLKRATNTNAYAVTLSSVVFTPYANGTGCSDSTCVCVTTNSTSSGSTTSTTTTSAINGSTNTAAGKTCYVANLVWSAALTSVPNAPGAFSETRGSNGCGKLTPVVAGTASSLTTLPLGLYGPFGLLIADVSYQYRPTYTAFVTGNITFLESAYLAPRIGIINNTNAPYVDYSPANASPVCAAYQHS